MRRGVRIFSTRLAKLLVVALFLAAAAYPQQEYKIHAKVDLVVVPVTVKGSGDKLIADLKKEDFVVLEDGRPQTVTNFTIDPVPLSAAVVLDTGLASDSLSKIHKTFAALARAFSPFHEVALYRYDKFVTKGLDLSADAESVENATKKLRGGEPRTAN